MRLPEGVAYPMPLGSHITSPELIAAGSTGLGRIRRTVPTGANTGNIDDECTLIVADHGLGCNNRRHKSTRSLTGLIGPVTQEARFHIERSGVPCILQTPETYCLAKQCWSSQTEPRLSH